MVEKKRIRMLLLWCAVAAAGACSRGGAGESGSKAKGPGAQPDIQAREAKFEFGKVKQGAPVEHVFKIANAGKADLVIKQATGS